MPSTATLSGRCYNEDGSTASIWETTVPARDVPLWWQKKGLSFTSSGYGKRIPTRMMVLFKGKWRRVYVCQFSDAGTAYIGKWIVGRGPEITVGTI